MALQLGLRRSEYSQDNSSGLLHNVEMCPVNTPKAFILDDVEFYTSSKQKLSRKAHAHRTVRTLRSIILVRYD